MNPAPQGGSSLVWSPEKCFVDADTVYPPSIRSSLRRVRPDGSLSQVSRVKHQNDPKWASHFLRDPHKIVVFLLVSLKSNIKVAGTSNVCISRSMFLSELLPPEKVKEFCLMDPGGGGSGAL